MAGPDMEQEVRRLLTDDGAGTGNVFFHHNPTNDAWCRDHGPDLRAARTAARREEAIVDWNYNAWGGKYPPYDLDDVIPTRIAAGARPAGVPSGHRDGGRVDRRERPRHAAHDRGLPAQSQPQSRSSTATRSRATCATTSACRTSSGWATGSPATTPTATWTTSPASWTRATVVTVVEDDPADENYEPLQENLERLRRMRDQDGRPLRVVTLPMPRAAVPRGAAASGELRQLLHRQRPGAAAHLRSRARRGGPATLQRLFPAGRSSASTAPTWCGASARSTASPSSGRQSGRLSGGELPNS